VAGSNRAPTAFERQAAAYFDRTAASYDRSHDAPTLAGHNQRVRLDAAVRAMGPGPGNALEIGFASGRLLEHLDRRGWTVWGVDAAPAMVALASARVPAAARRLVLGDAERLPFGDRRFDAVVCTGLLSYVVEATALAEVARVLRHGGRAVVSFRRRSPYSIVLDATYRRLVRSARRMGLGRARGAAGRRRPLPSHVATSLVERAGLRVESAAVVGCTVVPQIGAPDARSPALRIAREAEARSWARRMLATQLIVTASKPA
jgi:ubiquinone/menaquinone biosynthesis C-methylase UbiE